MEVPKDFLVLAELVDGDGERIGIFRAGDICKIDIWRRKKNYEIPRYHTLTGIYSGTLLTMEDCREAFPWMFQADISNLINLDLVDHVEDTSFALTAYFPAGIAPANVARVKRRYVAHLIKET